MTIPTSWTSTGLSWAAADPMWPLELLNPCMIEAIKECDAITGRTVPALLSATYNPIRPNRDYVNDIHSEVSALIPLFVNHLDNGGNWNGQATIPNFTEATILTAVGDASRIVPATLDTLSAWYFQTYKILNMLRWVQSAWSITASGRKDCYNTTTPEWDSAVAEFNAASWSGGTTKAQHWAAHYGSDVRVGRDRLIYSSASAPISFDFNFYSSFTTSFLGGSYVNNDYPFPNDGKIYNINSGSAAAGNIGTFGFGDITAITLPDPGAGGNESGWGMGTYQKVIQKFDGANGRKFLA